MRKIICITCLIFISLFVFSQSEKIETDRPGYTNTSNTTPAKWIQFETGFLRQSDKFNPPYKDLLFQHPSIVTKYGIGKRLELRLITDISTIIDEAINLTDTRTGLTNLQIGAKWNFLKEKKIRPNIAIIAHYNFLRFKIITNRYDSVDGANFRFAMEHTLSRSFSLGYNVGMEWRSFPSKPAYTYSVAPKLKIDEKWLIFVEVFGFAWKKRTPENSIDFGVAYYISNNFKIDASAGFGLNKKAPDNFYSIGTSFRFKAGK